MTTFVERKTKSNMKTTIEIINSIDYAMTSDGKKFVAVREVKNKYKEVFFYVEIFNPKFHEKQIKFSSPEKALNKFYALCLEMNLSTWNHSLKI